MSDGMGDISFQENKKIPIHRWHEYVAGYDAKFVQSVIKNFCTPPDHPDDDRPLIFDPYCGVGTTLVEAIDLGCDALGTEINPYTAFVARTKTDWDIYYPDLRDDVNQFLEEVKPQLLHHFPHKTLETVNSDYEDVEIKAKSPIPDLANINNWYTDSVLEQLRILKGNIHQIEEEGLKNLALLAFAGILVEASNGEYGPSLSYKRDSDGNIIENEANVFRLFKEKIQMFTDDLEEKVGAREDFYGDAAVIVSDGEEHPPIQEEVADLLITSPPYANNMNYIRQTRPHLYWLDYWDGRTRRKFEDNMMGSYWQIVRKQEIEPKYPVESLEEVLEEIRKQEPEREELGGPGWARYVTRYFNDLGNGLSEQRRLLKPGAHMVYVVGNSVIKGVNVPVAEIMVDMVKEHFNLEVPMDPTSSNDRRVGSSLRTEQLNDVVVTLKRPES